MTDGTPGGAPQGRESEVVRALVSLAGSLATGRSDVVELLTELVTTCARLLDVAAAGLLLADDRAVLHVIAASSDEAAHVEAMQLQRHEGPCLDCYRTGLPSAAPDLETEPRWPRFVPAARQAGYASVHAVPLRLQRQILGALGLFGAHAGALNAPDLLLAQGLADIAGVALVQDRAASDSTEVRTQLQAALDSRVVLEQAKGMVAFSTDGTTDEAFVLLRQYARDHNLRLSDLARALVDRRLPLGALLEHDAARRRRRR